MLSEDFQNGTLYLGDARDMVRTMPDNSVDLILTDPPFGLGLDEYDNGNLLFEVEDELWRVSKPNTWLVVYWSIKVLPSIFQLKKFGFVWQMICHFEHTHSKWIGGDRAYLPILVFGKGSPKVLLRRSDTVPSEELPIVVERVRNPQFKPTVATSILLQMFSREGDLVLDPFAGFGSIPLVCEWFNRRWIGCEIDEDKYRIATKFIQERRARRIVIRGKHLSSQMAMDLI